MVSHIWHHDLWECMFCNIQCPSKFSVFVTFLGACYLPMSLQNSSYPCWDSVSHLPEKAMTGWRWCWWQSEVRWWQRKVQVNNQLSLNILSPPSNSPSFVMAWRVCTHHNQVINFYGSTTLHAKWQVIKDLTARLLASWLDRQKVITKSCIICLSMLSHNKMWILLPM